ncbi:MAG: sulfur relay protein DsrC [Gammaproteobacteria bacterium]|nr:sulfur relay protein DsrC [Gammaproteobacteria bacterium]
MFYLSDVLKQEHEIDNFQDFLEVLRVKARQGEIHMNIDVRPPFKDTPKDWENVVEVAFTFPNRS